MTRATGFILLARGWNLVTGPLTALLIATIFTPELQGYYFTFGSIIAFQTFIELGLGNVITQFVSHEWAKLGISDKGEVVGDAESLSRLRSIARFSFKWYGVASAILAAGLIVGGFIFFSQKADDISWRLQWFLLCILNSVVFFLLPAWSIIEGCNQVNNLYRFRFFQSIVISLTTWAAIITGSNLWTASLISFANIVYAFLFIGKKYLAFFKSITIQKPSTAAISWGADIWPMQWRVSITYLIGGLTYYLFTPLLFHYHGAKVAGQMGMTWSLNMAMCAIPGAWLAPKVPMFGMLVSQKNWEELDRLLWRIFKLTIAISVIAGVGVWSVILLINLLELKIAERVLPPVVSGMFILANLLIMTTLPLGYYLRAHKKEPTMVLSVLGGVCMAILAFVFGKSHGALGMAASYLVLQLILVPAVFFIWYRCRKAWHAENQDTSDVLK